MKFMIDNQMAELDLYNKKLYMGNEVYIFPDTLYYKQPKVYLKISRECNLNCPYCFQKSDLNKSFDSSRLPHEYRHITDSLKKEKDVTFVLFGGEPLLTQNIKELYFLTNELYQGSNKILVYTNGNYSDVCRDFICANRDKIFPIITIDGAEEEHNRRRPNKDGNSYQNIISNCSDLIKNKVEFSISTNIDETNISHIDFLVEELERHFDFNGGTNIILNRVLREKNSIAESELLNLYVSLQNKKYRSYLSVNSNTLLNLMSIITGRGLEVERCCVASTRVFDFCDENIYACPQSTETKIGEFDRTQVLINNDKVAKYAQICRKEKKSSCQACELRYICSEGCVLENGDKGSGCKTETIKSMKIILENFSAFFM